MSTFKKGKKIIRSWLELPRRQKDDLAKVREIVHDLQRPGIAPDLVYAHDWKEGDLVLFNTSKLKPSDIIV